MDEGISASAFRAGFFGRVKAAREARKLSQEAICELLGVKQPTYGKYESRSMMPHSLIPRFLIACGVSYEWLFTGRGRGPAWRPIYPDDAKPRVQRPKRAPQRVA